MNIYLIKIVAYQIDSFITNLDYSIFKVHHFEKINDSYLIAYSGPREILITKMGYATADLEGSN